MSDAAAASGFPRLTYLRIKNYRALRDVELRDLTPLTVFIGPNGSGKSTVLDALAFLAEAVSGNLQQAWEKRNRFAGMRTRGQEGAIEFEVIIQLSQKIAVQYLLEIDESLEGFAHISNEILDIIKPKKKKLFDLNRHGIEADIVSVKARGSGKTSEFPPALFNIYNSVARGANNKISAFNVPYLYFQSVLGHPNKTRLEVEQPMANIISSYRYIHLTDDHLKGYSDAGPREKLSANGDNLPNVLYYLHTKHPEALARITDKLRRWVPQLADVVPEITSDERLLLRFKDAAFEKPLPAQYMSDGTMRLAALLTLLYEPNATGLLGLEEPENELHPRLLLRLAEELVQATEMRQLLVATHSPALLDALEPEQVWILHRGADGYTQATRTADIPQVKELVEDGSPLGYLWTSNFFRLGDPLAPRPSAAQ